MILHFRASFIVVFLGLGSVFAAPPATPTNFSLVRSSANDSATLEWTDNANDETLHQFEITIGGGAPFLNTAQGADQTSITFTGFSPGVDYGFRLRSGKPLAGGNVGELETSDWTPLITVRTRDLNVRSSAVTGTPGEDLSYTVPVPSNMDGAVLQTTGTLPSWVNFDPTSRTFSAMNPPEGSVRVNYVAVDGIHERAGFLYFNIINEGPQVITPPSPVGVVVGGETQIDLSDFFKDGDLIRAASILTNYGEIQMGFYEGFPVTVDNFFAYLEDDAWDGAFFHRMAKLGNGENFVLQGGGFKRGASEGLFSRVNQFDSIVNEFDTSRRNLCGTISMAKLGGDPNSATNQFFVSLNDNRANLDVQNGGFTVFGRATDLEAANLISTLPLGDFTVNIDGVQSTLGDWPVSEITPDSPRFDQLATMTDVVEISPLSFALEVDQAGVITPRLEGVFSDQLVIEALQVGAAGLTVTVTDLDGAKVEAIVPVAVLNTFEAWSGGVGVPSNEEDNDLGGLTNFEEYAYVGNPNVKADDAQLLPSVSVDDVGVGAITFRHRTHVSDLDYVVEVSSDLSQWDPVWDSEDGFMAANVIEAVEVGEATVLKIRNEEAVPLGSELYFRLRVKRIVEVQE